MNAGAWVVEETMLPLSSVDVITTFAEAVAAAVRRLLDKTTWPCESVDETTIGMIAAVPVEVVVIPCAFVVVIAVERNAIGETGWLAEIIAPGTTVIGALGINGEKLVETTVCPPFCVEVCKTGIAATGAVETRVLPCALVEVTAIEIVVAEGVRRGLAPGRLSGAD